MSLVLQQIIVQADNAKSYTIADDTGTYNVTTNPGGYGSPNPATTDILTAVQTILKYNTATTYTKTLYSTLPTTDNSVTVSVANTDLGLASTEVIADGIYLLTYAVTGRFAITAVSTGTKTFTVSGDKSGTFAVGDTFTVTGSTGNNATYTVTGIVFSTPNTLITVSETVPDATADGYINFSAESSQYEMFYNTAQTCILDKLTLIEIDECKDCTESKVKFISKLNTFLYAAIYAANCGKVNKAAALLEYTNTLCDLETCRDCE